MLFPGGRLRRPSHIFVADLNVKPVRVLHVKAVLILTWIETLMSEPSLKIARIIVINPEHDVCDHSRLLGGSQDQPAVTKTQGRLLFRLHTTCEAKRCLVPG